MPKAVDPLRVVKKLSPLQAGAIKLARKYGEALLCVRYRNDSDNLHRITTVELIIDRTPIQHRPAATVEVLEFDDDTQRQLALDGGASWDGEAKVWKVPQRVATRIGVLRSARKR